MQSRGQQIVLCLMMQNSRVGRGQRRPLWGKKERDITVHHLKFELKKHVYSYDARWEKQLYNLLRMSAIGAEELRRTVSASGYFQPFPSVPDARRERDDGTETRGRRWPPAVCTSMTSFRTENSNTDTAVTCRTTQHLLYRCVLSYSPVLNELH